MAPERGLPSVPRGLSRDLTLFLQAILRVLSSLSGLGPGTEKTRAVRVSEERLYGAGTAALSADAVSTQHIKDGAITSAKLADGCVTEVKLAAKSVTLEKLADSALAASIEGIAEGGETVELGLWHGEPHVALLGFTVPLAVDATLHVGIQNLREEGGGWVFDAVAYSSEGGEEANAQTANPGQISWRASGIRRGEDEPAE